MSAAIAGIEMQAPEYVRRIAPYVAGKPMEELAREYGLPLQKIVKLASNENPRGPSPNVRAAIAAAFADITRYPDANGFALKAALAERYALASEQVVLGNGSNDILDLVSQAFLKPGDHAVYAQHAFVVYPLVTQARGALGIEVPATPELGHDLDAMRAAIDAKTRIVFVANPNNPTGSWVTPSALRAFIEAVPRDVIVVVDEAYDEYLAASDQGQTARWLDGQPNLVVSRTFSKAYGLAGLRIGYGLMHRSVADLLNRVRQPFNVNALAQTAAIAALADRAYVEESATLNRRGLDELSAGAGRLGLQVVPSHGNFVLIRVGDAARVYESLLRQGIIVRPVANYGLPEHLRVTTGLPEENARFLAALEKALKPS